MKTAIWTEGIADQKFLADLLGEWHGLNFIQISVPSLKKPKKYNKLKFVSEKNEFQPVVEIFDLEGKDDFLKPENAEKFDGLFSLYDANLVIMDADESASERRIELEAQQSLFKNEFSFFLFQDGTGKGDLESLLTQIVNPQNAAIFECWAAYEDCLRGKENLNKADRKFTTPASKTKIYAYLEALLGESKKQKKLIKEAERNYRNPSHWNLKADQLNPLKTFLKTQLFLAAD